MKKTTVLTALLFFFARLAFSQDWHSASDTLRLPPSPGGFYPAIGSTHMYDTVRIIYQTSDDQQLHRGWKRIRHRFGYYIDDSSTMLVILDDKLRRVDRVRRYYFQ